MAGEWPRFDKARDSSTFAMLHLASQMLGKLRVAHSTWENHGWHATLRPVPEGLTIKPITAGDISFALTIDLCRHAIVLRTNHGIRESLPLAQASVASLHRELIDMLERHKLPSKFHGTPNEVADAIPFAKDKQPRDYRPESAAALRDALALMVPVFERFRAGFLGKGSPVQFFWGSFDLAVTRFSGRPAPRHPGGVPGLPDRITREAYSHEVSSAGFWPGGVVEADPIFYSYAYPEPDGFRKHAISTGAFDADLGEFVLPYAEVVTAADPGSALTKFLQSTYEAASNLSNWDRQALEREPVAP